MGEILAREAPADADLVIAVPDSGNPAATGFARASGLPKDDGLIKNRYVPATFIQPGQELRKHGLRMKFNPLPEIVSGKRVVVVDDSIVRGNTTRQIVGMLRDAGAKEVHLRISAPPIRHPCHYGVDMSTREEMIAHGRDEARGRGRGRRRLARLPLARGRLRGGGHPAGEPLRRLLHGRLPARRRRRGRRQVRARGAAGRSSAHLSWRDRPGTGRLWAPALAMAAVLAVGAPPALGAPPNVVVLQTDDQPAATLTRDVMPRTHRLLVEQGTTFTNYFATTPLCCPSRASLLTGQYAHNHGALLNHYGRVRQKANVLPSWLQRAGYVTSHVGKFMNEFPIALGPAPGWDRWASTANSLPYGYDLYFDGRLRRYGYGPRDHLTRVVAGLATREVRHLSARGPFYLQVDFPAPHAAPFDPAGGCAGAPVPEPRDRGATRGSPAPDPPSLNEADVSDKPTFLGARRALDRRALEGLARSHRCTVAALGGVDRAVGRIVRALSREGELGRTAIVFVSDNGVLAGEHRIADGKHFPYEEAIHVPMAVRLPEPMRERAPGQVSGLAANIDLAPTILDLAGAGPCVRRERCRTMDGLSLAGALQGAALPRRDLLIELDDPSPLGSGKPCAYEGVRTTGRLYVEYRQAEPPGLSGPCLPTEAVEHYDLRSDPHELENLHPAPAGSPDAVAERDLAARLDRLRGCAGIEGRDDRVGTRPFCATAGAGGANAPRRGA